MKLDHEAKNETPSDEEEESFRLKRRQAGALLKDLDSSLDQLEVMVENQKKHSIN